MKKSLVVLSLIAVASMSACQEKKSSVYGAPEDVVDYDYDLSLDNAPDCSDRVIRSYNRVINQATRFTWSGQISHLRNLVAACGELRSLLRNESCVATDLSTGELILVGYQDLKTVCDQAREYHTNYDRNRTGFSSKSGEERQRSFDLGRMRDKEGLRRAPDRSKRPSPPRGSSEPSPGRPRPGQAPSGVPGR